MLDASKSLTELALLQPDVSVDRPGHKIALFIIGLMNSTEQPRLVLWQALAQLLKLPHSSPPAIYHSSDSFYIDLTMEPSNHSLKVVEGTIFKFNGSIRHTKHSPSKGLAPPSKIRIQLFTASYPHHDLPHNLNSQVEYQNEGRKGWVNEVVLSNEGNFHVTAALPPTLSLTTGHLHVCCSLFNPIKRSYFFTGPIFSISIY